MTKTAALALISAKFSAVLNTEIRGHLTIQVVDSAGTISMLAEGTTEDLARARTFVAAHLSAQLAYKHSYDADEDGPAADYYVVA